MLVRESTKLEAESILSITANEWAEALDPWKNYCPSATTRSPAMTDVLDRLDVILDALNDNTPRPVGANGGSH